MGAFRDGVTVGNFSVFTGLGDADVDGIVRPTPIFRTPGTDNSLEGYSFSSLGDFDGDGLQEILVGRDPRVTLETKMSAGTSGTSSTTASSSVSGSAALAVRKQILWAT